MISAKVKITICALDGKSQAQTDWFRIHMYDDELRAYDTPELLNTPTYEMISWEAFRQTNTYQGPAFKAVAKVSDRSHTALSVGDIIEIRELHDVGFYTTVRLENEGFKVIDKGIYLESDEIVCSSEATPVYREFGGYGD